MIQKWAQLCLLYPLRAYSGYFPALIAAEVQHIIEKRSRRLNAL